MPHHPSIAITSLSGTLPGLAAVLALHEDTGGFPDAVSGGSRLTTVTQLVPVTDDEYAHADAHGVESLMQMLAAADADLRDLGRRSVVK